MNGLDVAVFRAINGLSERPAAFFVFLSEATKLSIGRGILVTVFILLLLFKVSRKPALLAMLAWPLANLVTDVLKDAWQWSRPSWPEVRVIYPDIHVRVDPLTSYGTASAHAANMMAVAVTFLFLYRPLGWVWLVLAVLVGVSRVYVGVHWPSEVVLGWLCGAFASTLIVKCWEAGVNLRKGKTVEDPSPHPEES